MIGCFSYLRYPLFQKYPIFHRKPDSILFYSLELIILLFPILLYAVRILHHPYSKLLDPLLYINTKEKPPTNPLRNIKNPFGKLS